MTSGEEKSSDFYAVLGLNKECTPTELRTAYMKLAKKWHPDRCSASGNSMHVEEANKKFQAIQQAYSVLSDESKRFLYDVGAYDSDDDENGMGDFLNEMAVMMSQKKSTESGEESFEELQELFEEMFQSDIDSSFGSSYDYSSTSTSWSASSSFTSYGDNSGSNKQNSSDLSSGKPCMDGSSSFEAQFHSFCLGAEQRGGSNRRRNGPKQKVSYDDDVSSNDYGIPAVHDKSVFTSQFSYQYDNCRDEDAPLWPKWLDYNQNDWETIDLALVYEHK